MLRLCEAVRLLQGIAKLVPGTTIRVEVIGKLPEAFAVEPKIGDLLP